MAEVHLADDFYLSKERGDAKKILTELIAIKGGRLHSGELVGNVRREAPSARANGGDARPRRVLRPYGSRESGGSRSAHNLRLRG